MKTLLLTMALFVGLQPIESQETLDLGSFSKILIKGNLEVDLVYGPQEMLEIESGEEDRVEYNIENNQLQIRHREMYRYKSYRDFPIRVTITYNELRNLDARAGARVKAAESISGIRLDMHLGSGAHFQGDVQVEKIDVDIAEGAIAKLTGRANRFTAIASTGGNLEALEVEAEDSRVRSTMGGIAKISAHKSLDAKANMGGVIIYKGKPEQFVMTNNLGGTICKKD